MALAVIGAGFGRTGTLSMKTAIDILRFGPCHHMVEVNSTPGQREQWRALVAGGEPDWDSAFAGYGAAVDWPGAFYWRELSEYHPDAKIILTVRSPESWYASMSNTIFPLLMKSTDLESVGLKLIAERVFGGILDDQAHAIAIYQDNIAEVQASFTSDRLLTFTLGDGWEPLCRFLDVPIPEVAFPSSNSTDDFNRRVGS
jgi:hypothetical protein